MSTGDPNAGLYACAESTFPRAMLPVPKQRFDDGSYLVDLRKV